jgi:hypothetical protein
MLRAREDFGIARLTAGHTQAPSQYPPPLPHTQTPDLANTRKCSNNMCVWGGGEGGSASGALASLAFGRRGTGPGSAILLVAAAWQWQNNARANTITDTDATCQPLPTVTHGWVLLQVHTEKGGHVAAAQNLPSTTASALAHIASLTHRTPTHPHPPRGTARSNARPSVVLRLAAPVAHTEVAVRGVQPAVDVPQGPAVGAHRHTRAGSANG